MPTIFDIAVSTVSDVQLRDCLPRIVPPKPFDPQSVKIGGMVNPEAIAKKIESKRKGHAMMLGKFNANLHSAKTLQLSQFKETCSPLVLAKRVLAVGYVVDGHRMKIHLRQYASIHEVVEADDDDLLDRLESSLLSVFWENFLTRYSKSDRMIGHDIFRYHLPFLLHRSWALGILVPDHVWSNNRWSSVFLDLREHWQLGTSIQDGIDLNSLHKKMGGSPIETEGSFEELYFGDGPQDHLLALSHLDANLGMSQCVCTQMRIGLPK